MAWALWGHIPMPGMASEYRSASFMTGDDSTDVSMASKKARGRAAAQNEGQGPVRGTVKREAGSVASTDLKEQFYCAEHQNAKCFRRSMMDLGRLEMEMGILNKELDQANFLVLEFWKEVMAKRDLFDNMEKYKDWYPFQQWKAGREACDSVLKEMAWLRDQTKERDDFLHLKKLVILHWRQ